ncbi:GAS2 domain-containing protein [Phyllosticta citribraziliensis]|uniref:GAS2 domain-containing protein n=1 Tax=Phyllosticta citribraziliensis TaxID=989973 RepID=A0ABR1MAD5_9PEZI
MTSRPPSALSLSAPVLDRRKVGDAPSPSPTRDRRRNVSAFDAAWPISPSATLKAFTEGVDSSATTPNDQTLLASLSNASPAEKDLGVRVASATHKIKSWCAELEQWTWPDTFEEPPRQLDRIAEHSSGPNAVRAAYWGSLPAARVQAYGERLDQIKDELEDLNMDELKGHILDMYPMDRWQSAPSEGKKRADLHLLDDFSYVVTHTMLQALPCLSYLNQLSRTWTMRVAVLRDVPKFLGGLKEAKKALRLGWDSLIPPKELEPSQKALAEWKEAAETIRSVLETQVRSLGQKLDRMLDSLEDMNDSLPDHWIDDFEELEAEYGKWCSDAQRRIFEADMLMSRPPERLTRPTSARGADQPLPFGGTRLTSPRDSRFLSPEDSPFSLLSETSNDSPKVSGRSGEPSPGINSLAEPLSKKQESGNLRRLNDSPSPSTPTSPENGRHQARAEPAVEESSSDRMVGESVPRKSGTVASSDADDDLLSAGTTPERELRSSYRSVGSMRSNSSVGTPDDSPSIRALPGRNTRARPPLNSAMFKRGAKGRQTSGTSAGHGSDEDSKPFERSSLSPTEPTFRLARKNQHRRQSSATQDLEAQIRKIITSVHAPIHLSSGGDNSPTDWASRSVRTFSGSRAGSRPPSSLRVSRKPSTPSMILSPVKSEHGSGNARNFQRDSGIKLYHLIQPGQDKPIKLFVRRVGPNGERVMVRVGGGWADLGEYLRQYVEHHSRRVVSDSKFEILGVEHTPEGVRPTSSHSNAGSNKSNKSNKSKFLGTPATGNSNTPASRSRPGSAMSNYSSMGREDFGNSVGSQRSWAGSEVGLAGPNTKKHDLSEDKLEWIEGMMNQARLLHINDETKPAPTKKMYVKHAEKHGH